MKTKFLFTIVLLGVAFSCKNNNDEVANSEADRLAKVFAYFKDAHNETIQFQAKNLGSFMSVQNGRVVVDTEGLAKKNIERLSQGFFHIGLSSYDISKIAAGMYSPKSTSAGRSSTTDEFGNPIEQNYFDDMNGAQNSGQAASITDEYVSQVVLSNLSFDQKVETLSYVAAGDAWSQYVFSGGAARDYGSIFVAYPDDQYQTLGNCSVNWRGVFISATRGFFTGFVGGCIAGAAGGTIVIPGAGTVTGCIGVGFTAGAGGFASGVAWGVVDSLIESCTRNG